MPSQRDKSRSDAYWKKRYTEAGVVPSPQGVTVTRPTNRMGFESSYPQSQINEFVQTQYNPIADAIRRGNPAVVSSSTIDFANNAFRQGLIDESQKNYITSSITNMRQQMSRTPIQTSDGQQIPYGRMGRVQGPKGTFGTVPDRLMHSDLIQYNPDGSWGYVPSGTADAINAVTRANYKRQQGIQAGATPVNADAETASILGSRAAGVALGGFKAVMPGIDISGLRGDDESFLGRTISGAQGFQSGFAAKPMEMMSGLTQGTSYLGARMAGRSPQSANQIASDIKEQTPWYQKSNEMLAPGMTNSEFAFGAQVGAEAFTAVPALYTSLGLLNSAGSLGARMLAGFGTKASNIGRYIGIGSSVAAPTATAAFRDQLTGGQPGVREDLVAGFETVMDPIRSTMQRGMTESGAIAQQEFDPKGEIQSALQQAGILGMASGGSVQMWKDVKNQSAIGIQAMRDSLKVSRNPFTALGSGLSASIESEVGKAAAADLGFAMTQPLSDIGRMVYANTRIDKSTPIDTPDAGDVFKSLMLGLVASRPGKDAQFIFRGNPLQNLEPKTMALSHATDIVNKGGPELQALVKHYNAKYNADIKPNDVDIRRIASVMAADNAANLQTLAKFGEVPEGTPIYKTTGEYVEAYVNNPDLFPEALRAKYDTLLTNMRGNKDKINLEDGNPLNNIELSNEYKTDLITRRRRIKEYTDALLPVYTEQMKQFGKKQPDPSAKIRYYGIDTNDGNMLLFDRDFKNATLVPKHESEDIGMLKPQYSTVDNVLTPEQKQDRQNIYELIDNLRGKIIRFGGEDAVITGFDRYKIYVKTESGKSELINRSVIQDLLSDTSDLSNEQINVLEQVATLIDSLINTQSIPDTNLIPYTAQIKDDRFKLNIPNYGRTTSRLPEGNLVDTFRGTDIFQLHDGSYAIFAKGDIPASVSPEYTDVRERQPSNRGSVWRVSKDTDNGTVVVDLVLSENQRAKLTAEVPEGSTAEKGIEKVYDYADPFTHDVGDIVSVPQQDGSEARYVIIEKFNDSAIGVRVDDPAATPAIIFDDPALKVEKIDRGFLQSKLEAAGRVTGSDLTAIRPEGNEITNILQHAMYMSSRDESVDGPAITYDEIINSLPEELSGVIHNVLTRDAETLGVERNVVASLREWLLKNRESAADFELYLQTSMATEITKSARDISVQKLARLTRILENGELNALVDQLVGVYDTDAATSAEVMYSSSPRRIGTAKGEFLTLLGVANKINRLMMRDKGITDATIERVVNKDLGEDPRFEGKLDVALQTIKRLSKLSSLVNPIALGVILNKGSVWQMEKLALLPQDIQVLSALLPYEDMPAVYADSFGEWFTSREKYNAAVTRAQDLYSTAVANGPDAIANLKRALYDARLGYFYEIAARAPELATRIDMERDSPESISASRQRSADAVHDVVKRLATEKLAIIAKQLADNKTSPDMAVPVPMNELLAVSRIADSDGSFDLAIISDVDAMDALVGNEEAVQKLIDMGRKLVNDVDNDDILTGVSVYEQEGFAVSPGALQTAKAQQQNKALLASATKQFNNLTPESKAAITYLGSPLIQLSELIRAIDNSNDDGLRQALIFGIMNAVGTDGSTNLGFELSKLFRSLDAANRFSDYASDVMAKKIQSDETGESKETKRKTSIRGAMDLLLKLRSEMISPDGTSLLEDAANYYTQAGIKPSDLYSFMSMVSQEVTTSMLDVLAKNKEANHMEVMALISDHAADLKNVARIAGSVEGDQATKQAVLELLQTVTTDGLQYLGVTFDPRTRVLISDAVAAVINKGKQSTAGLNSVEQARAMLEEARSLSVQIADFVLGDKSLADQPSAAYTPAAEATAERVVNAIDGNTFHQRSGANKDAAAYLLLAGNRAGLEKIILATLFDAASKDQIQFESIDKAIIEATLGPEVARKYFARVNQARYVTDKIIFGTDGRLRAAVMPGGAEVYTLPDATKHDLIEGQSVLNHFMRKAYELLAPRDKAKFTEAVANYIAKKRSESNAQEFEFEIKDLMTIAEGFAGTRNQLFKVSNDAKTLAYGLPINKTFTTAYKVKSLIGSIRGSVSDSPLNAESDFSVESQFNNLGNRRSFIEAFDNVSIYDRIDDVDLTESDADQLASFYTIMSKDELYNPTQKAGFAELAKYYRTVKRSSQINAGDKNITRVSNRFADARAIAANLAKVYDTYANRNSTRKITSDIENNYDLDQYKALTAFLGLDQDAYNAIMLPEAVTSVAQLLNKDSQILSKDQQKMLVALRAAQLKQDFYNQNHKLFFAHEAEIAKLGYDRSEVAGESVEASITRVRQGDAISSILFMASTTKNFDKTSLAMAHEISHQLFYSLPDKSQLDWINAITRPLNIQQSDDKINPEIALFYDYLKGQNKAYTDLSAGNKNSFRLQSIEEFAARKGGYTREQIGIAKRIWGESSATSLVNYILNNGVVADVTNPKVYVGEDITSALINLQSVLKPMAERLALNHGAYTTVDGKPNNVFHYRPGSVVYQSQSKQGVNRAFYPMKHGSVVSFVNNKAKKTSSAVKVIDVHDVIMSNKSANKVNIREAMAALKEFIPADVAQELTQKINALQDKGIVYGDDYYLSIHGNDGYTKQDTGTTAAEGYNVVGKVVGMAREKTTMADIPSGLGSFTYRGKSWMTVSKGETSAANTPWYTLKTYEHSQRGAKFIQNGTKGDYGYVVESSAGLRLNVVRGRATTVDLGENGFNRKTTLKYVVGHDLISEQDGLYMVGTSDSASPQFMSVLYQMLSQIDKKIIDIAGQRTYEYETRINAALADGMRTGSFDKWDEVVSIPLAAASEKNIKNIISGTPSEELAAVRNTGTHAYVRNQVHAKNLLRWANNLPAEQKAVVLPLIQEITVQHAALVADKLGGTEGSLSDRLLGIFNKSTDWYSFLPIATKDVSDRGVTRAVAALYEQGFTDFGDVQQFLQQAIGARMQLMNDPLALDLAKFFPSESVDGVKARSLVVDIDGVKVDVSTFVDQLFGLNTPDSNLQANYQQFLLTWAGVAFDGWYKENQSVLGNNTVNLETRLKQLYELYNDPTVLNERNASRTELATIDNKPQPKELTVYDLVGLSQDYMSGNKRRVDVDSMLRFAASRAGNADQFIQVLGGLKNAVDFRQTFDPKSTLSVVPHAVLDHILNKTFTDDVSRINFMNLVAGRIPEGATKYDVIRARNLFNVVEHLVKTDAKIRNAALRNWKSYDIVDTMPEQGQVILRSPDRDIAADAKGASKSGALYRVNLNDGRVSLVAKSLRFNAASGKYVESYQDIQDVDSFLKYNWSDRAGSKGKEDPFAFKAANNSPVYTSMDVFGTDNVQEVYGHLSSIAGVDNVISSYNSEQPLYFMLPYDFIGKDTSKGPDGTNETNVLGEIDSNATRDNAGMYVIKAKYNKSAKTWEFQQTQPNWSTSDNYRSQLPSGLLRMITDGFDETGSIPLSAEQRNKLVSNTMLHEEYHIAKLLLAKDRASSNTQYSKLNQIGHKVLFPSGTEYMQDASTGTWYSSHPTFDSGKSDSIPVQDEEIIPYVNDTADPEVDIKYDAVNDYARVQRDANVQPDTVTFYKDPKTKGGMMVSGNRRNPVLHISSDIWADSVDTPLKGTEFETTVGDGKALTFDGAVIDRVFSSSPKFNNAAYNIHKHVLSPFKALSIAVTLAVDISSVGIQLATQVRNPLVLLKSLLYTVPEAVAFNTKDIGFVIGDVIHGIRQKNARSGKQGFLTNAWNADVKYYNWIMNTVVDRFNRYNNKGAAISMSELIDTYYMPSGYSDWYKKHKANAIADPLKYRDIIDTPFETDIENSLVGQIPGKLLPAWNRWDMSRTLVMDLCMLQNALRAVRDARADTSLKPHEVEQSIRASLMKYGREMAMGSHSQSKIQMPAAKFLSNVVNYFMTAPGYNRHFSQYWGFNNWTLPAKKAINDWSVVNTVNAPKWFRGEVFDIKSDLDFQQYGQTPWSDRRQRKEQGWALGMWAGMGFVNMGLNWISHMINNPAEDYDPTEWMNISSKRFGYQRLNDNWVVAMPLLKRIGSQLKPFQAFQSAENYGAKEKMQAFADAWVKMMFKNRIHNGGQFIMSSITGKTFNGAPAFDRNAGLKVAVQNDVRAPMYFHPAGYLNPNQSNLFMDTFTLAHTNQYYDDLLKMALYSDEARRMMTREELATEMSMPDRVAVSKAAARELYIKGLIPRLFGIDVMYEPRAYEKANKDIKVNIAGSTPSLGRAVYMLRDWYKFPNLLQTLRQDPNAVLHGYDIGEDLSAQSLGLPSAQAQDRGTVEMKRLPLNNVTRSIADWYGK
jgi:hypothetical protein